MTHTQNRLKSASLTLSSVMILTCLSVPLSAVADTSSSVDAIMEQLKTLNTQAPKVLTPPPATTTIMPADVGTTTYARETEIVDKKSAISPAISAPMVPVKTEAVPTTSVYVSPQTKPAPIIEPAFSEVFVEQQNIDPPAPAVKKRVKPRKRATRADRANNRKRVTRKERATKRLRPARRNRANKSKKVSQKQVAKTNVISSKNQGAVDYKGFDERYMSLIYDILNEKPPTASQVGNATTKASFTGIGGWIYLGKYSKGRWRSGKTLKVGNAFPQVGQQYSVKSPLLNMRTDRPKNSRLGKLLRVLYVGDKVQIKHISRSSKNNYWASIVRP